jgi:glucosylceramidase
VKSLNGHLIVRTVVVACLLVLGFFASFSCVTKKSKNWVSFVGCDVDQSQFIALGQASVIVTASGEKFNSWTPSSVYRNESAHCPAIYVVDATSTFQTIDGFGASFLEAGLKTLNTLPSTTEQDQVFTNIFDPTSGAGFSLMKTVIGSTDFQSATQAWYSYAETVGDTSLSSFSIARDLDVSGLITYINRARQNGGDFRLQATMDYPPDWMLYDVNSNQDVNQAYYSTLANYFIKYLQEYEAQNVHIDALSPFNEPGVYTKISWAGIRDLIKNNLGPALASSGLTTSLMLSEAQFRSDTPQYYPTVLDDPTASSYISMVAFHGYDWSNYSLLRDTINAYPTKKFWMTEVCCVFRKPGGPGLNNGNSLAQAIISDLEVGVSGWIFWNMILDETGGPWLVSPVHEDPDPNPQDSLVVVNKTTHEVVYTDLFYYLAHFSKFIRPGAQRISTSPTESYGVRAISFKNSDGTMAVQLLNTSQASIEGEIQIKKCSIFVSLPPVSISTYKFTEPAGCS